MPDIWRARVLNEQCGLWDLIGVLARGWENNKWQAFTMDDHLELTGQIELAGEIFKLAQSELTQ